MFQVAACHWWTYYKMTHAAGVYSECQMEPMAGLA